jgi:hypothetical protein
MVLKIRSVEPFLLRAPKNAGSISEFAHTARRRSVAGTKILSKDACYIQPKMPGAGWTPTEAAMSSNAKPC